MYKVLAIRSGISKKGKAYKLLTVSSDDGSIGQVFDFTSDPVSVGDLVELRITFTKDFKPFVVVC